MQIYIVAGATYFTSFNSKSLAYRGLLLFNLISAITAFYPSNFHAEIVDSPYLWKIMLYGVIGIVGLLLLVFTVTRFKGIPNITQRKIFHLPPFIMFPLLNNDARSLFLVALVGGFYVLLVIELLRYHFDPDKDYAPEALQNVWMWMKGFIDKRDRHLWVTHISLFSGMMTSYYSNTNSLIQNSAVILPLGDACAAIVGSTYGRIKVTKISLRSGAKALRAQLLLWVEHFSGSISWHSHSGGFLNCKVYCFQ